ncbi:MAG: RHS repeat-associated core domain-containing protein [Roseiflexaceae bacterium]
MGAYTYTATASGCAAGTPATKPHAASQAGGTTYAYDGDGERVKKVKGSTTTYYLGALWEEDSSGATKAYYSFNGQVVAMRAASGVTYLHGDHLGSVSVSTNSSGALVSQQTFDPWGKVRSGGIGQTELNYTGQRLDMTGLLYYHARMYDPLLGRFASADSVVPNPADPQDLNRYTYVSNNPLNRTDPTGHVRACMSEIVCRGGSGEFPRGPGGGGGAAAAGGVALRFGLLVVVAVGVNAAADAARQRAARQQAPAPASSDTGGNTASPGAQDPNDPDKLPVSQQIIRDALLDEHPGLNPRVAAEASRGGASAAGKGGPGADVRLLNGGGREVSVHSGQFTSRALAQHLMDEASQEGTTEIYLQINTAGATREGMLQMIGGLRNGYRELAGQFVKIFGSNGEVWWNGVFRAPPPQ